MCDSPLDGKGMIVMMFLKIVFLFLLCIPVAYLQYLLLSDVVKDLEAHKKVSVRRRHTAVSKPRHFSSEWRIAR